MMPFGDLWDCKTMVLVEARDRLGAKRRVDLSVLDVAEPTAVVWQDGRARFQGDELSSTR
jgi:hypothetical protein